jgi:hypothetical protein
MIQQMNAREKTLAVIVGTLLVALTTYMLASFFQKNYTKLKSQLRDRQTELDAMKTLSTERELWLKRDAFFREQQPPLANPGGAGVALLEEAKEIAQKHSIVVENPTIGTPEVRPNYQAVSVTLETKSEWKNLIDFIYELQAPNSFIVFESAKIALDPSDKTQFRGNFRLSKWFAPK